MSLTIRCTLGVAYQQFRDPKIISVDVDTTDLTDGFDPEDVFVACNRIEDVDNDVNGLVHVWQRQLRLELDRIGAPSMNVGDVIAILDPRGHGHMFIVATTGFTKGEVETIAPPAFERIYPR